MHIADDPRGDTAIDRDQHLAGPDLVDGVSTRIAANRSQPFATHRADTLGVVA